MVSSFHLSGYTLKMICDVAESICQYIILGLPMVREVYSFKRRASEPGMDYIGIDHFYSSHSVFHT